MRIAVGQLWQETNTFTPLPTTRDDFHAFGVYEGHELVDRMADTNELGGFIQSLRRWPEKPEIVGLARLAAWPCGPVIAETFDWLRATFLRPLDHAGPLDGVLLALHGAMAAEGHPDVEGEILSAVRQRIGGQVPLVATLDLHANVTQAMVRAADALVLYHTAPHVDVVETGQRGAAVLHRILTKRLRPVSWFTKVPVVPPAERANTERPGTVSAELKDRLVQLEQMPGVLAAGLATMQPWLDVPELGSSVLVVTESDTVDGHAHCAEIATELWRRRSEYLPELIDIESAVRQAHEIKDGLVVLSDPADATTSGAPGDSTWLLQELLRYEWPRTALVTLVAPDVVQQARKLGEGQRIDTNVGGVRDVRFGKSIPLSATIERLFDARFAISGHLASNLAIDMGPSAILRSRDVRIVVTSRSGPHFAPELFKMAGIDPFEVSVLVAKSPCGFRAAYESRARKIMSVKAPGCAPSDFWNYEYQHVTHPTWPWDPVESWQPTPLRIPSPISQAG